MNHIYRVIFNHSANCWQAVSEIGKGKHKAKSEKNLAEDENSENNACLPACLPACLAIIVSAILHSPAYAAPQGGQVSAGQATISQQQLTTDIHQSSQNAVINWQKFDIQPNETVNFHQPNAESITLNRVVGNEESAIRGAMNANGNVFISNPNGVLIGKEAQINVGSLVATTQNIKDDDLMNNRLNFNGQAGGKVENNANIKVPKGGVIAFIAPIVKNSGKLTASEGVVLLASAEQFRITLPKDNFSYTLDRGTLQGLVDNKGAILADGGRVVLTAKGIDAVKKSVIKHSGAIEANTVSNKNGVVELLGDLDNSELQMTGSIKAEGKGTQQGGQVETSAAKLKISEKAQVSTKSEKGKTGKWTIDPKDFTVAKSGGDMSGQAVSNALKNNNVELKSRNGAKDGKGDVIINDEISWDKNTLALNAENDIHINKTLNGSGTAKLALEYGQGSDDGMSSSINLEKDTKFQTRTVRVNLPEGKNLTTQKGLSGEVMEFDVIHRMPEIKPDGSTEQFSSKYIALGKDIDLSYTKNHPNFLGWGEKAPEPYYGAFLNLSIFEGLGHRLSNLNISSEQGAENEESNGRHPYVEVGLFRNYEPNPENPNEPNRIISNVHLTDVNINTPNYWHVGGLVGNGQNIGIYNSSVSGTVIGKQQVGGLIGALSENGEIYNSHINGSISGSHFIGGLVGEADSKNGKINIEYGSAKGLVRGHTGNSGGLVGLATEIELSNSFSRNTIEGGDNLGGVIGVSSGNSISDVYSDSNINSSGYHGGIIGLEAPFKYSHKEYTSYLKRVVYAGNALTFLGKIEENKVDGERVVFNHENPNPDRNLVQEINNGHYDFKHIDIDDNQIWTVDESGIVKLREFTNNKPDYILDIDKPEPTPPDETDNIPQTTDIKVNYDKEKGFMIIPATQHEQLKITYTDNNGSTHTVHIKQGADAFWYFPSGNSTGSALNKNNGVLRWLNNLQEGSWITVEGMNSDSPSMVRKFEVDEFTGRKARLAEEKRIRREQQLAEQRRKDAELKEKQRLEELANKNNGNQSSGANSNAGNTTNSGGNTGSTAAPSNPPRTGTVNYDEAYAKANTNVEAAIATYEKIKVLILNNPSQLDFYNRVINSAKNNAKNSIKALPVNMRKPLEDRLSKVGTLSLPGKSTTSMETYKNQEPMPRGTVKNDSDIVLGKEKANDEVITQKYNKNTYFTHTIKNQNSSICSSESCQKFMDNLFGSSFREEFSSDTIAYLAAGAMSEYAGYMLQSVSNSHTLAHLLGDSQKFFQKAAVEFAQQSGEQLRVTNKTGLKDYTLNFVFGFVQKAAENGFKKWVEHLGVAEDYSILLAKPISEGLVNALKNPFKGEPLTKDFLSNLISSSLDAVKESVIKPWVKDIYPDDWIGKAEIDSLGDILADMGVATLSTAISANIEHGLGSANALIQFKKDLLIQLTLISGKQVIKNIETMIGTSQQMKEVLGNHAESINQIAATRDRIRFFEQHGQTAKVEYLKNSLTNHFKLGKTGGIGSLVALTPEHINVLESTLADVVLEAQRGNTQLAAAKLRLAFTHAETADSQLSFFSNFTVDRLYGGALSGIKSHKDFVIAMTRALGMAEYYKK